MNVITITNDNFEDEVLKSDNPVLMDFWAPWCGACKMLSPVMAEIAGEYGEEIKVGKINIDEEEELSTRFHITSIPTIILVKNGKITRRFVGYYSKLQLVDLLNLKIK